MNYFEEKVSQVVERDFERDFEVVEDDLFEKKDQTIKCNNMSFIKQYTKDASKKEVKKNEKSGWSNPTLSDGKTLDEESVEYKNIRSEIEDIAEKNGESSVPEYLTLNLDRSFRKIAGYYANYENKWYNEMKFLFVERADFVNFYYDLLIECLMGFDGDRKSTETYENDFRKSKGSSCHFNQYFFGALGKRKITEIKKRSSTKRNPNILCECCGEHVGKITNFHLKHSYDEQRISKEFGVKPTVVEIDGKKVRMYDECPITGEKNVDMDHIKSLNYATPMTVEEYMHVYPNSQLSGLVCSLQTPVSESGDTGGSATLEDLYQDTASSCSDEAVNSFSEHIENVFDGDREVIEILKLKVLDYKNSEIAEIIGEENTFYCPIEDGTEGMTRKTDLVNYFHLNKDILGAEEYLERNKNIYIVSREMVGKGKLQWEAISVTSCSATRVSHVMTKLRDDMPKMKDLFYNKKKASLSFPIERRCARI